MFKNSSVHTKEDYDDMGKLLGGSQVGSSLGRISTVAFLGEYFTSIIFKESKGKTFLFFRFKPCSHKNFLTFFLLQFPFQSNHRIQTI